ncbi:MAG: hypothetical protein UW94_C0005G0096 [Parcubacteria group bacterium GW2011_GWA2_45_14]|nr:MAG: hypothetical protein UW94_C0005G0096 [Parcubacteria group bacterium GW2011_GWA2_45_14]
MGNGRWRGHLTGMDWVELGCELARGIRWLAREMIKTIPRDSKVPLSSCRAGKVWVINRAFSALVTKVAGTSKLATKVAGAYLRAVYQVNT